MTFAHDGGLLLASAVAEGYGKGQDSGPIPYRGYYFHILTRQGKKGPGGAKSYGVNGKMTDGFAFVAYPAEYRSSGVMTFIVGVDGVVYERDLGKKTEDVAKTMKEAFATPGPVLIDIVIPKEEAVMPMIPPGGGMSEMLFA